METVRAPLSPWIPASKMYITFFGHRSRLSNMSYKRVALK
ncbi:hypothetical protein JCM19236_5762 [Vibrio sp. JCM 19236]|nr:hypothetical protein JCM19236_5762 [Vibrio sp. JCM 19236]